MPITPYFTLSQTSSHVLVDIAVPHVRVNAETVQVVIEDHSILHFASPPYWLRLNFHDNEFDEYADENCATYSIPNGDVDYVDVHQHVDPQYRHGRILLQLRKKIIPSHWKDLELIGRWVMTMENNGKTNIKQSPPCGTTTLSTSSNHKTSNWLQEIIGSNDNCDDDCHHHNDNNIQKENKEDDNDEEDDENGNVSLTPASRRYYYGYGFARNFHGIFTDLNRDGMAKEMMASIWNEHPHQQQQQEKHSEEEDDEDEETYRQQRKQERLQMEQQDFSAQRYLDDLDAIIHNEDYYYQCAMTMKPHWKINGEHQQQQEDKEITSNQMHHGDSKRMEDLTNDMTNLTVADTSKSTFSSTAFFSPQEQSQLASIPYPLLPQTSSNTIIQNPDFHTIVMTGLCDILFAYVYDHLLTEGEPNVESAWTVTTLSITLGWLEEIENLSLMLEYSIRRSLIYPYLRHVDWSLYVWKQVSEILKGGFLPTIRCLLQTRIILHQSECYYLGNKLYIDPYLTWIQQQPPHDDTLPLSTLFQTTANQIEEELALHNSQSWKRRVGLGILDLEASYYSATTQPERYHDEDSTDTSYESNDNESVTASSEEDEDQSSDDDDDTSSKEGKRNQASCLPSNCPHTQSQPLSSSSSELLDENLLPVPAGDDCYLANTSLVSSLDVSSNIFQPQQHEETLNLRSTCDSYTKKVLIQEL